MLGCLQSSCTANAQLSSACIFLHAGLLCLLICSCTAHAQLSPKSLTLGHNSDANAGHTCAGPGRRKLKVKDPEQYHWHPKELLAAICSIYIHLARADARGVFAAAIAADGRCYRPDMFPEAAQVRQGAPQWPPVVVAGCREGSGPCGSCPYPFSWLRRGCRLVSGVVGCRACCTRALFPEAHQCQLATHQSCCVMAVRHAAMLSGWPLQEVGLMRRCCAASCCWGRGR